MFGTEVSVAVWGIDVSETDLYPAEAEAVARAVEKRQVDFARGRSCARSALLAGGGEAGPIPVGAHRQPLFPADWVGSITHCDGFVAAAVSTAHDALGLDAERVTALEKGVVDLILTDHDAGARASPERTSVVFSAKESVFKAVFPTTRAWLGFEEVGLTVTDGGFSVGWTAPSVDVPELAHLEGRWRVVDDLVLTVCWLPRR